MMKKRKMSTTAPVAMGGGAGTGINKPEADKKITNNDFIKINRSNPQARDGHACVVYESKMLIFGGDRYQNPYNDLFLIDLEDFFFSKDAVINTDGDAGTAVKITS